MATSKKPAGEELAFKEPSKKQTLRFAVLPTSKLEVIKHQRKPSDSHVGKVITSIEKLGFLAPLVVVESDDDSFLILDGQHRFLAAQQLELKQLPVVIVPPELARRMLGLNVEKEPNIRERSAVALSLYRELVETSPDDSEDEPFVADSVDHAHYVTLGLGYEESGRLAGSSFEPILKKCDGFLDQPLSKAYEIRQERAATVVEANTLVRAIADKLKEIGAWHQFVGAQIIGYANPLKRARKPASFDATFSKMIDKLHELEEHPEKALRGSGD
jgi:ParB family transcriptional regulator, chromosome partitioning protein